MLSFQLLWMHRRRKPSKLAIILFCLSMIPVFFIYLIGIGLINNEDNDNVVILGDSYAYKGTDYSVKEKRDLIKNMMKDAWDNYVQYAWGANELLPLSKTGSEAKIGVSIVDALDTLYIMGLKDEYLQGRNWIAENLNLDLANYELSVFETNIRFLGGLLSCYAMTGDTMYRDQAYKLAKQLLPAFETPTGIPHGLIGHSQNQNYASYSSGILAEFGTLHLEFVYLSDITGDDTFKEKVYKIREILKLIEKPKGLYSNYIDPGTGKFTSYHHVSMGSCGDSFYEYLLKSYIQTGDINARQMYDEAIDAFEKNGLIRSSEEDLLYFAEMRHDSIDYSMEHLACFAGGMLALGAHTSPNTTGWEPPNGNRSIRHMEMAERITNTCHESYIRTYARLGPERFRFSDGLEATALFEKEKFYILRPEVVESYFVLWRITGDPKYREWGWDAAQAIEKHCKVGKDGGYSGILDVYSKDPGHDGVQQSFFLAETLKYLYLLFSSKNLIDLDYWVFNTEAHPLPIKGVNPYYRLYQHEDNSN